MNRKKFFLFLAVMLTFAATSVFAITPREGYYTSKDNDYQVLIRPLGDGYFYVRYFTPNGGTLLTSQGRFGTTGSRNPSQFDFTDDAGNARSAWFYSATTFRCYVTGGTFSWNRNP